jgi:integrase/recombinase XerD
VVQNTMGRIFTRLNSNEDELWWIEITGKGNKTRMIPMTDELLGELERYRREMGLSLKPFEGEATPLLIPIGGKQRPLTRAAVHLILKKVFMDTAKRLEMRGPESASKAARLMAASAHWLRHTAGSNMASNMDIHYVRDNMGHGSIATTNNYIHTEEDKRHVITQLNHKLAW